MLEILPPSFPVIIEQTFANVNIFRTFVLKNVFDEKGEMKDVKNDYNKKPEIWKHWFLSLLFAKIRNKKVIFIYKILEMEYNCKKVGVEVCNEGTEIENLF